MDPDRKRQIINAEERFTLRERLNRALAEKGIYVLGTLTHDAPMLSLLIDAAEGTDVDQSVTLSPARSKHDVVARSETPDA